MEPSTSTSRSFIEAINQSYAHLFRTLIFFVLLFIFLFIALVLFFKSLVSNAELKVKFDSTGGVVLEAKKESLLSPTESKIFTSFLLPSNAAWFDTGLELGPDQECSFKVTGTAHLAIQRIVYSSESDQKCPIPWTSPKGNEWVDIGDVDAQLNAKKKLLLKPGNTIGNIVAYYCPSGLTNQFSDYFTKNRNTLKTNIIEINEGKTIPNSIKEKARIFLSVNDILLNFNGDYTQISKLAYCGKNKTREKKWEEIKSSGYTNLYFDDNVGNFLVQVEIKDKAKL